MRALLICQNEVSGGAARAAHRQLLALRSHGVDAKMLVADKKSDSPFVVEFSNRWRKIASNLSKYFQKGPFLFYPNRDKQIYSHQLAPDFVKSDIRKMRPDVVNLHWVGNGFVSPETIGNLKPPTIWTMHDMWPFTGGCHYAMGCTGYQSRCGSCPQLGAKSQYDISRLLWKRKWSSWKNKRLTLVSPSEWLANCARKSSLFRDHRIEVIPNGLDLAVFRPLDRKYARHILNLPQDRLFVLFVAERATADPRKGFAYLERALSHLPSILKKDDVSLLVVGASWSQTVSKHRFDSHFLGKISDDVSLSLLYNAADLLVVPSVLDNLPNTATEAMACGTPVVAFDAGGLKDIVDHHLNGFLAKSGSSTELAYGIREILTLENPDSYRKAARQKAENEWSAEQMAKRYLSLYQEITTQ